MSETPRTADVADVLDKIGSLLEVEEASPFRIRAYRNAADTLRALDPPVADMVAAGADLTELDDVGPAIAEKIAEIVRTGPRAYVEQLAAEAGPGVFELLRVPGLGPKRVRALRSLGIGSLDELRAAATEGRLRALPGFGAKTEESIVRRLDRMAEREGAE